MHRDDITVLGVPLAKLCNEAFSVARIRILMKNVAYVGALAALMDIDLEVIKTLLEETFASKPKLVESNLKAIMLGYDYARKTSPAPAGPRRDHGRQQRQHHDHRQRSHRPGLSVCRRHRGRLVSDYAIHRGDGQLHRVLREVPDRPGNRGQTFCIIQAEDELAAAGMVMGANWVGARALRPPRARAFH